MRRDRFAASAAGAVFCVATLGASQAAAQSYDGWVAGTVGAGWTDFLTPHASTNDWTANGSVVFTVGNPGFNLQANFANNALEIPRSGTTASQSSDLWSYGGDVFWRDYAGSTGIDINFASAISSGSTTFKSGTASYDTYGWFGQFFALPDLTLELKGGRVEDRLEGWYGDAGAIFYPYPTIGLNLTLDYADAQHVRREMKDASFVAEYLPVREVPVSLYIGYDYAEYSQISPHHVNIFLVGVKAYLGGGGREGTLVDYQRNGTTNWDGAPATLIGLGF
jgi:hypothetical protein